MKHINGNTWSADLAYAVGLIAADGSLSNDKRHIDLTSKDFEQVKNFSTILGLKNKIGLKGSSYTDKSVYYRVQFGNVKLYKFLLNIGLMPNKTKKLGRMKIPDNFFPDFLRGFLDGDGYTYSYWDKRWKSSYMLYLGFVSASKRHLLWLQGKIKTLYGVEGSFRYSGKSTYHLSFAKNASIKLLEIMYYNDQVVCLSRKRFKIDKALGIIERQKAGVLKLVYRHD